MNRIYCFILGWALMPTLLLAQSGGKQVKIGFGLDGISYVGDLSDPDQAIHRIYPGANLSIQMEGPKRLKLQLNGGFGKFSEQYDNLIPSTDPTVKVNTFVETSFFYGDLRLKYRFPVSRYFHPFLTLGAGVLVFTPRDETGRFLSDAAFTREAGETYSTTVPQIPVGAGVQTRINPSVSVSLEYLFRYTPTDYLDNIGRLGTRRGHDYLHGLQLSLYITLSPPDEPVGPGPYHNAGLPGNDSSLLIEDVLPTDQPYEPSISEAAADSVLLEENVPEEELEAIATETAPDTVDWAEREAAAIAAEDFIYYKVKKQDSLASIAQQYHVSVEGLMQVNYLSSQTIIKGQTLRIPKVE